MQNKKIRILTLGDSGVGKTQWISSLLSNNFNEKLEKVIAPVTLPPELCVISYDISTDLIDTSSNPQDFDRVKEEIKDANVILLFYDVTNRDSINRLKDYWLPQINETNADIPVIIIGNKIDLLDDIRNENQVENNRVQRVLLNLIRQFSQVEMGLECSAVEQNNVRDIIYCAQRAVLFPLAPLYDMNKKQLKPEFEKALTRIFRICDKDLDGVWNDQELVDFQSDVFKGELTSEDIRSIKEIIRGEFNQETQDRGITLQGFLMLQKRCLELIKIQICWTILRYYGYNDKLKLNPELFKDQLINYEPNIGQSVELSDKALQFIGNQFDRFQKNHYLDQQQLEDIFKPIGELPWENLQEFIRFSEKKDENEQIQQVIKRHTWISLWNFLAHEDYKKTFKFLKYIGFQYSLSDTFIVTRKKENYSNFVQIHQRKVFNICIVGPPKSGKTKILNKLLNQPFQDNYEPTTQKKTIIVDNGHKTFIIHEIPQNQIQQLINEENQFTFDFVGIVYDTDEKLKQFQDNYLNNFSLIPKFYIHTFLNESKNEQPNLNSRVSVDFILNKDSAQTIISGILEQLIMRPQIGCDNALIKYLKDNDSFFDKPEGSIFLGISLVAIVGVSVVAARKYGFFSYFSKFFKKQ